MLTPALTFGPTRCLCYVTKWLLLQMDCATGHIPIPKNIKFCALHLYEYHVHNLTAPQHAKISVQMLHSAQVMLLSTLHEKLIWLAIHIQE